MSSSNADEEYRKAIDDVTKKELLVEISAQLADIRHLLNEIRLQETPRSETESDGTDRYQCRHCGSVVEPDKRESHMRSKHNAPPEALATEHFDEVAQ